MSFLRHSPIISIVSLLAGEVKDQASQKVDQAKDKANEVASDAKKKGEGENSFEFLFNWSQFFSWLEVKNDADRKGRIATVRFEFLIQCFSF